MKNLFLVLAVALMNTPAYAIDIRCTSPANALAQVTLESKYFRVTEDDVAIMNEVVMTFTNEGKTETGRINSLSSNTHYNPRRYKGHYQFNMSQLVDTTNFGPYLPGDTCSVNFMFPRSPASKAKFEAPMIVNCDQSGGSMTLICQTTARN